VTRLDWIAMAGAVVLIGAFLLAFFLYLRTAYRHGGWKEVKWDFVLAIIVLIAFYVIRVSQNEELNILKEGVNRITK
jgi:Zn-dependent protease with chaperone function